MWKAPISLIITNKGGGGAHSAPHINFALRTVLGIFFPYHPSNIYTMKVHVAWEHSSFKNVDLVAVTIQSFDPQARVFNWRIFGKV